MKIRRQIEAGTNLNSRNGAINLNRGNHGVHR
jgi:hypothetical protein